MARAGFGEDRDGVGMTLTQPTGGEVTGGPLCQPFEALPRPARTRQGQRRGAEQVPGRAQPLAGAAGG